MTAIYVFGSNLAGRHGRGAALAARRKHGAVIGVGVGPTGSCYAIPTKDQNLNVLPLPEIQGYVDDFIRYARENPELQFWVTPIGCGLAGYTAEQIAPMFTCTGSNVVLPTAWADVLMDHVDFRLLEFWDGWI